MITYVGIYLPTHPHRNSTDFSALFEHQCTTYDDATPCCPNLYPFPNAGCRDPRLLRQNCSTTFKPSLLAKFGSALAPSEGKSGTVNTNCFYRSGYLLSQGFSPLTYQVEARKYGGLFLEGMCGLATPAGTSCFDPRDTSVPQDYSQCSPQFLYPWFGGKTATYVPWASRGYHEGAFPQPAEPVAGWTPPADSETRRLFRLPVADISKMLCTPSPFINAGHADNPLAERPRRNIAGFMVPCNDLMTQVRSAGAGEKAMLFLFMYYTYFWYKP